MKHPPFHITTILFDYIIAFAACCLAAFLSILIMLLVTRDNQDHWRNGIFTLNIVWSVLFYMMRRRFPFKIALVQIMISCIVTGLTGYLGFTLLDRLENSGDTIPYLVLFFILTVFVVTKHISDKYILARHPAQMQ